VVAEDEGEFVSAESLVFVYEPEPNRLNRPGGSRVGRPREREDPSPVNVRASASGVSEQMVLPLDAFAPADLASPAEFRASDRVLRVSECFDAYWRFAAERQRIFHHRAAGMPPPWTADPVLSRHKFTNVYLSGLALCPFLPSIDLNQVTLAGVCVCLWLPCKSAIDACGASRDRARCQPDCRRRSLRS
jgi:hypothetical protein